MLQIYHCEVLSLSFSPFFPSTVVGPHPVNGGHPFGVSHSMGLRGPKSMYSKKIADQIIAGMRDGRFMGDVAGELGFTVRVVNKWKHAHEDFADRLLKSRADGVYSALDTAKENLINATNRDEILKAKEMLNQIRWEAEKLVAAFQPVVKSEVKHEGPQIAVIRWEDAGDVALDAEQTVPVRAGAKTTQKPRKSGLHKADVKPQGTKAIH